MYVFRCLKVSSWASGFNSQSVEIGIFNNKLIIDALKAGVEHKDLSFK